MKRSLLVLILACISLPLALSGCAAALLGGAAAGGYMAHKEGYTLQNPIKKSEEPKQELPPIP
jgi:hypothetical protein